MRLSIISVKIISITLILVMSACTGAKQGASVAGIVTKAPLIPQGLSLLEAFKRMKESKDYAAILSVYATVKNSTLQIEELKIVADVMFQKEMYNDLLEVLEKIKAVAPFIEDSRLSLMAGVAYFNLGNLEASHRNLLKAADLGNKSELLYYYLFRLYLAKDQIDEAKKTVKFLKGDLRDYLEGYIFFKERRYDIAYEKIERLGDYADTPLLAAYALYNTNMFDKLYELEGRGYFDEYPEALVLIANSRIMQGMPLKAKQLLEKALKIDQGSAEIYKNLGLINDIYFNDQAEAKKYYSEYLKMRPDDENIRKRIKN